MVKKIVTGLAISVGAGFAFAAATRGTTKNRLWHPSRSEAKVTPVTIRVHSAVHRAEPAHEEMTAPSVLDHVPYPSAREHSAGLAEIKVMIETLDQRSNEMMSTVNQRIDDLQNHLPRFIDVKVTSRIREVEERLRTEFQDEQSKTLDAFLGTLEQKVLPRLTVVEEAVGVQGAEINHMRQRIEKTDETLDRVLQRIEMVVDSMMAPPLPAYANSHVKEFHQKAVA